MNTLNKFYILLLSLFALSASYANSNVQIFGSDEVENVGVEVVYEVDSLEVKVVSFDKFKPLLHQDSDTVYVINFWATWCGPCIKEIPYFEQLGNKYNDSNLKIIMVSLDMPNQIESKLIPFIEKNSIKNDVILLDDPDFNKWIPIVDKEWTGAIPATLIYSNSFREFYAKELTFTELEETVKPLLTN
jgi:thiol-disulfide isomerase/thioredoxin